VRALHPIAFPRPRRGLHRRVQDRESAVLIPAGDALTCARRSHPAKNFAFRLRFPPTSRRHSFRVEIDLGRLSERTERRSFRRISARWARRASTRYDRSRDDGVGKHLRFPSRRPDKGRSIGRVSLHLTRSAQCARSERLAVCVACGAGALHAREGWTRAFALTAQVEVKQR